jgi:hypothetical protein
VSDVPEDSYNKIRLILNQVELVFHDDRSPAYPRLPGNGKLDLNPRETFHVDSDQPLAIQLDFDAKKSIHVVQTGNQEKYNFRPVVFVQIVEGEFDTKLIRQRGTINDLDIADGEFKLCLIEVEIQPISSDEDDLRDCVLVDTTTAPASIFDDFANPVDLEDLDVGDIVTVVGRFRLRTDSVVVNPLDSDNGNENGNGNGNGNSNKKDMEEDEGEDLEDSSDEDSTDDDAEHNQLVLIAEVVWSGTEIMQSDNIACSDVTEVFETDQDGEENMLFNQMGASALMSGQIANAFGKENVEGCLSADTIIYEEEEGGEEGEVV